MSRQQQWRVRWFLPGRDPNGLPVPMCCGAGLGEGTHTAHALGMREVRFSEMVLRVIKLGGAVDPQLAPR